MTQDQAKAAITDAFEQYMNKGFAVQGGDVAPLQPAVSVAVGGTPPGTFRVVLDLDPHRKAWHAVFHAP